MTLGRWKKLMDSFGFAENEAAYNSILNQYSEAYRAYHNAEHISDCLEKLDMFGEALENRNVIELAIWFHDIVYNPYGKHNELKSARAAADFLKRNSSDEALIQRVSGLILATQHTATTTSEEEKIITDIDLSILGAPSEAYDRYSDNIRKEYKRIPALIFRKKRKEVLKQFLDRKPLFQKPLFQEKFEQKARDNINRELQRYS